MTIGILGYLSARGLGTMTHDLRVQLGIQHQMVPVDVGWPYITSWATGDEFYLDEWTVQKEDLELWKEHFGIDTLVSIETGYGDNTFRWAKELGMRTILVVMWESFNPNLPAYKNVDLYICPSYRAYQEIPFDAKLFLPYPVDTDLFKYRQRSGPAKTFVHNAGSGGMHGRKGTVEAVQGFCLAQKEMPDMELIVRSQEEIGAILPVSSRWNDRNIHFEGPRENREDLYTEGEVLIATHRYDGHFLVGLEAMACGMPVITTNWPPMNEFWVPSEQNLLVKVEREEKPGGLVNPHCMMQIPSVEDIAEKIKFCATHDMSGISTMNRKIIEIEHSWAVLKPRWKKALGIRQ